jgi:hypothetical protein
VGLSIQLDIQSFNLVLEQLFRFLLRDAPEPTK